MIQTYAGHSTGGHSFERWHLEVFGCPGCKSSLVPMDSVLTCESCGTAYSVLNGIPALISPDTALEMTAGHLPVKEFYLFERYDWTKDPKGLEYIYHHTRRAETWHYIEKLLPSDGIVLDIGCGTGLITHRLATIRQKAVALDMNLWALNQMNGKPYIVKAQADAEMLPVQDSSVDMVIATEVVEHLENPEATLQEMLRVCRPGGWLVGSVPSTNSIWKMRQHLSMTCAGNEPFHRNFTRNEITDLWHRVGYDGQIHGICFGLNWLWTVQK
ncbi:methyltransferase domain-containing protein [Dehalogenimonas sp. 4OHTPN]|uniref:Methyltransferase domain-containing protein n=1 Tax=Dehalogenimonas sp. 4OHTPN TaxID=3166643 RepID=A0AAU8GB54_9CHLR